MLPDTNDEAAQFAAASAGLHRGDFSRLAPVFEPAPADGKTPVIAWHAAGRFGADPAALAEAFTCACFLGRVEVVAYLLAHGMAPSGGAATGLDALHWAVNRGQLAVVRLLLQARAPLETRNRYGGTALGIAVWSAIHEPRPDHALIVEELLRAGSRRDEIELPTGNTAIDAVLRAHDGGDGS